jgi:hypothetical protein
VSIGISGTREGMNPAQHMEVELLLESAFDVSGGVLLHGDCVGVDEEVHRIAQRLGYFIEIYPPENPKYRAFCDGDVIHAKHGYIVRNHLIVDAASTMLIIPERSMEDSPRSGTWATYRYAMEVRRPTTVIAGGRFEFDNDLQVPAQEEFPLGELQVPRRSEVPPGTVHRQGPGE